MKTWKTTLGASTLAAVVLGVTLGAGDPKSLVIEVDAGPHSRQAAPVFLSVSQDWAHGQTLKLTRLDTQEPVAVQLVASQPPSVTWIVRDLPAKTTQRYRLEVAAASPARSTVTWTDDGRGLILKVGSRPVLRYNYAELASPPGLDPVYARSGHIHPLFTPSGAVVTDDFPPDHAHQHALFFAWVNTTFDGHRVDFWNQNGRTGRVKHVEVLERDYGPVFAQFKTRLRHEDVTKPDAPVPVLDEDWTVRVYDRSDVFLVDFESKQACIAPKPLEINKYHYGGFGLRGNRAWLDATAQGEAPPDPKRSGRSDFLTSDGKRRSNGNHTRPHWVDLSGEIEGTPCGVAVFDHPGNYQYPQPVRLHPNKPYFCFAPSVLGSFTLEPRRPYVSRYRLVLHDGPPDADVLERLFSDFAEPPAVRVVND